MEISDSDPDDNGPIYSTLHNQSDMIEIVREYVKALPDRVQTLRDALRDSEMETIRIVAHGLHGSGGGFGFMAVSDISAKIEEMAGKGAASGEVEGALDELGNIVERITRAYDE